MAYEEEILRNQYSVKCWLRYIQHKKSSQNPAAANIIYERALKELPGRSAPYICLCIAMVNVAVDFISISPIVFIHRNRKRYIF